MTTSVIYGSSLRGQNVQYGGDGNDINPGAGVTATTIGLDSPYTNLSTFLTTKVTSPQAVVNASGSTANPSATFGSTPTSGNVLLCIFLQTGTSTTTSAISGSGWALLTSAQSGGSRRAECWWKRAGASEPTAVTMTNAGTSPWDMQLSEYGGWAALADPVAIMAAANVTTATSFGLVSTGMHRGVFAFVCGAGSWGTPSVSTTTGANESQALNLSNTRAAVGQIVGWNNSEASSCTFAVTTTRAVTRFAVGWPHNTTSVLASFGNQVGISPSSATLAGQVGIEFDTSSIPAANTVSVATLTIKSAPTSVVWPSVADSEIFSINSTAIAKTASNTRTLWRTPTEVAALTKVASRPAGSAYAVSTSYAWTSNAAFLAAINKASTTRLLVGTSEQRTGSLAGSQQSYNISQTAGDHFITIVHNLTIPGPAFSLGIGNIPSAETVSGVKKLVNHIKRAGGISSLEAFGGIARTNQKSYRVGGIVSGETFGGVRLKSLLRVGSITTGEQFGGFVLKAVLRAGSVSSGELVAGVRNLVQAGAQNIYPAGISSAEAFGTFTIFKRGGTVIAAHSLTGIVVATGPTVLGVVSAVESLTGAVASTHLLSP